MVKQFVANDIKQNRAGTMLVTCLQFKTIILHIHYTYTLHYITGWTSHPVRQAYLAGESVLIQRAHPKFKCAFLILAFNKSTFYILKG